MARQVIKRIWIIYCLLLIVVNANTFCMAKPKKVIYISHCNTWNRNYLNIAISKFQKMHPNLQVKVSKYFKSEDYKKGSYKEYLKLLNTKLMTGQGVDIVNLDKLPYRKYIEKKCFVNLSEYINKDKNFNLNDYQKNIIDGCKVKGQLYTLPVSFAFNIFAGNQKILKEEGINVNADKLSLDDVLAIAKKVSLDINKDGIPDRYALPPFGPEFLLPYSNDFFNFENKKAQFNSTNFIKLLNIGKILIDRKIAMPPTSLNNVLDALNRGTLVFFEFPVDSYHAISFLKAVFNGEIEVLNFSSIGGREMFTSDDIYAITQKSAHKTEAWQFLRFLLSEEVQREITNSFAINKKARQKNANNLLGKKVSCSINGRSIAVDPVTRNDIKKIDLLINDLQTNYYHDPTINSIIKTEVKLFLDGKRSAAETSKVIQNKVTIYLSE